MSIPNEALQKVNFSHNPSSSRPCLIIFDQLAQEIESQAASAQREINLVKAAVATKQRDIRMLELTTTEVKSVNKETNVYEGVGKM